jgi:AraC-like DNA-binding protein
MNVRRARRTLSDEANLSWRRRNKRAANSALAPLARCLLRAGHSRPSSAHSRLRFAGTGSDGNPGQQALESAALDPRFRGRYAHLNIAQIAHESGFGDVSYFNRMFRRRFGVTPSDVREEARHKRDP